MVQNHYLTTSITDAGQAVFLTIPGFKAACAGRSVEAVNPAVTSQIWLWRHDLKRLSVHWRSCPACGTSLHRDHNAGKNREWAGRARRGGVALGCVGELASMGL